MAVSHKVGYNRRTTPYKQYALNKAGGHLVASSAVVATYNRAPCFICDMTAGPGRDESGAIGSPLILARLIMSQVSIKRPVTLLCAEQFKPSRIALQDEMARCYPNLTTVEYFSDQAALLERVPTNAVGFTYWDPTAYKDLDEKLLTSFGRSHYMMDVLITRQCVATKRMKCAGVPGTLTIFDYLECASKRRNYIWQYADWDWWSFGFASNWKQRPPGKMGGLYDVKSEEARRRYYKLFGISLSDMEEGVTLPKQGELRWA